MKRDYEELLEARGILKEHLEERREVFNDICLVRTNDSIYAIDWRYLMSEKEKGKSKGLIQSYINFMVHVWFKIYVTIRVTYRKIKKAIRALLE